MHRSVSLAVTASALACTPLAAQLVGTEPFTYPNGNIANLTGGTGFNYDNFDKVVTAFVSDWDNVSATGPVITGNALITNNTSAKREYNGTTEGTGGTDGADDIERSGAVRGVGKVFYRVTLTRATGATWSGASSYDFGAERLFFGVPNGNAPSGVREFGCQISGGNAFFSGIVPDNNPHILVAVIDFDRDFIGMWVDPDANDYYDVKDGSNTVNCGGTYTGTNWSTAVRLGSGAGGNSTWDDLKVALDPVNVGVRDYKDIDGDGLPAWWETQYGLSDTDNGTIGETTPGAKNGPNGALGDGDADGLGNLAEYQRGTLPNDPDSDDDGLNDGPEVTATTNPLDPDTDDDLLTDGDEVNVYFSNPKLADSDGGGTIDSTELALNKNPNLSSDDPHTNGNLTLVGIDFFDSYTDGALSGGNGGTGWDYDNTTLPETFTGHTTRVSAWTNVGGVPSISGGALVTQETSIKRSFHAGTDVPTAPIVQVSGSFRENLAGTAANGSNQLYAKVTLNRQAGASWSGMSLYNYATENIFVGVPGAVNPASGVLEFGIEASGGALKAFSGTAPVVGQTYTVVAKFDFSTDTVKLWVNPDLGAPEASSTPAVTMAITLPAAMNGNALRLGSGGTGPATWDKLVAGTTWASLSSLPNDTDGDGMPDDYEVLNALNPNLNDAALDYDGDGRSNLAEYQGGTQANNADTDNDGLNDGTEETAAGTSPTLADTDGDGLKDGDEVNTYHTLPLVKDTDGDGQSDGGEVRGPGDNSSVTSSPTNAQDTVGAPLGLLGRDSFSYPDGPAGGLAGGQYFDYDNWFVNGPFVGHDANAASDWDGTAVVAGGVLLTRENAVYREFHGGTEGAGSDAAPTGARQGAINQELSHDAGVVYFKARMTRRAGANTSSLSSDDFGTERLAFGVVNAGQGPRWGIRDLAGATTTDNGALPVTDGQNYTVVGKLDFEHDLLSLWVDPDLASPEASNAPKVTQAYLGTNWSSGLRLSSTGTGDTEWDDVVAATKWELLGSDHLAMRLRIIGYNPATGVVSLAADSIPAGTFHLRSSADLGSFTPLTPAFQFDASTPQPFLIPLSSPAPAKLFFRAEEGGSP